MSSSDIDVNAVNKRTRENMVDDRVAGTTQKVLEEALIKEVVPETSDEEIAELATYMRGSLRWKITYFKLRVIMVLESLVWTLMDIVRAWRMRTAARINRNYQPKQAKHGNNTTQ